MDLFQSFLSCSSHDVLFHLKGWPLLFLAFLGLLTVGYYFKYQSKAIVYWLFLGTIPTIMWNFNCLLELATEVFLSLNHKGSFFVDGPILSKLCYFVTCHPQNLEYILKTNFNNFPKGSDFKEIFNILGDGIFSADFDSWCIQRKMAHAGFTSVEFKTLVSDLSKKVVEDQLVPFLAHVAKQNSAIDLQDMCLRFSFDINVSTLFGIEEKYLSIDLPTNHLAKAIDDAQEAILHRHAMPMFLWKLLRCLGVGREKKHAQAQKTIDVVLQKYITQKREDLLRGVETVDLLSFYIKSNDTLVQSDVFLRDAMLSFLIAGRDTIASGLVWFFWLVSKNPSVESKILKELKQLLSSKDGVYYEDKEWPVFFHGDDLKHLVYLHAALNESMRLYPPVPLNSKSVAKEDLLPDGTVVKPGMQMILPYYSVGRMPWIWGEDCLEFKPERWINDEGKLRPELLSKFFAFSVGPRSCLGKDISYTQMKLAVAAVLFNFNIAVVEGQDVCPKPIIVLHMKNGLMVNIKKRIITSPAGCSSTAKTQVRVPAPVII